MLNEHEIFFVQKRKLKKSLFIFSILNNIQSKWYSNKKWKNFGCPLYIVQKLGRLFLHHPPGTR